MSRSVLCPDFLAPVLLSVLDNAVVEGHPVVDGEGSCDEVLLVLPASLAITSSQLVMVESVYMIAFVNWAALA